MIEFNIQNWHTIRIIQFKISKIPLAEHSEKQWSNNNEDRNENLEIHM